jgi:hypothetical protein
VAEAAGDAWLVVVVWAGVVFLVVAAFLVVVVVVAVVVVLGVVVVLEAFLCELELPQPAIAAATVIASRARFIYTPPESFGRLRSSRWYTVPPSSAP